MKKLLSLTISFILILSTITISNVSVSAATTKEYTKSISTNVYKKLKLKDENVVSWQNGEKETLVITEHYIKQNIYLYKIPVNNPSKFTKIDINSKLKTLYKVETIFLTEIGNIIYENDTYYISGCFSEKSYEYDDFFKNATAFIISTKDGKTFESVFETKSGLNEEGYGENDFCISKFKDTYIFISNIFIDKNKQVVYYTSKDLEKWTPKKVNLKKLGFPKHKGDYGDPYVFDIKSITNDNIVFYISDFCYNSSYNFYFYTNDFKNYKEATFYKDDADSGKDFSGNDFYSHSATFYDYSRVYPRVNWYITNNPAKEGQKVLSFKYDYSKPFLVSSNPFKTSKGCISCLFYGKNLYVTKNTGKSVKKYNTNIESDKITYYGYFYEKESVNSTINLMVYNRNKLLVSKSVYAKYTSCKLKVTAKVFCLLGQDKILVLGVNGSQVMSIDSITKIAK